ncbi:MAG: PKD domain-containing protein [Myxococcales bacterium]
MRKILAWSVCGLLAFGCDDGGHDHGHSLGDGGLGDGGMGGGEPPVANAGADLSVTAGMLVTLDGSSSSDPDGDAIHYTWRQRSGSPVAFDGKAARPTFTAPGLTQQMTFELVVDDGTLSSQPDTVTVSVQGYDGKRADTLGDALAVAPILLGGSPVDVELGGEHLVIADEKEGVKIAGLEDPLHPNVVGSFPSTSRDVEVSWPHVFALSSTGDLSVLDASNPSQPSEIAKIEGSKNSGVDFTGNASIAVMSLGASGMQVIDASQPGYHVLATLDEAYGTGLQLVGNRLYFSAQDGLRIYDLTNPSQPVFLGSFDDGDGASLQYVAGNIAFARGRVNTTDVLRLIDVSNPASASARGSLELDNTGAAVTGNTLCASRWSQDTPGMDVINIANPDSPSIVGSFSTSTFEFPRAEGVRAQGNYCYLRRFLNVDIVDVSTPATPTLVSTIDSGSRDILVSGNYLYASVYDGLEVHDISNPANPSLVKKLELPGETSELTLAGTRLYLTSDILGAYEIDVSTPTSPKLIRELSVPLQMTDIDLRGDRLYATFKTTYASVEGLHIYDVSDAAHPTLLGAYRGGDTLGVEVPAGEDSMVYLHRYVSGIERVDVSDPGNAKTAGVMSQWCTNNSFDAANKRAYCSSSHSLYTLNFATTPPANLGTVDLGDVSAVRYTAPYMFAATEDNWAGMLAVDPLALDGPLAWAQPLGRDAEPLALAIGPAHAYAALRAGGVASARFAANLAPDPLVELEPGMYGASDVLVSDGRLYVANFNALQVYDVRDTTPKLVGSASLPAARRQLAVHDGNIFVVEDATLRVLDASLMPLVELPIDRWQTMAASANRLYLGTPMGLRQFDLSNPRAPTLRATYAAFMYGQLTANGDLVYTSSPTAFGQSSVIDFSDASAPTAVGSFVGSYLQAGNGILVGVGASGSVGVWDSDDADGAHAHGLTLARAGQRDGVRRGWRHRGLFLRLQ